MNNKLTQNYEVLKKTIKNNNLKKLLYWKNINFENKYKITKEKYLIFKPWNGGFNNVKMSLEIASVIAYRLNRILVMPSHTSFSIDHLKKQYELSEFFDVKNIGIETMNMKKFCSQNNITEDWDEIKNISKVYNFDITNSYINLTKEKEIDYKFHKERDIINIDNSPKNIYFDGNLLGSFYTILHDKNMNELKKYVGKCIHYNKIFFSMAESVIYYLESNYGIYYSMHIRRGDFNQVYKDVCVDIDTIYKNIKEIIPEGSYLYISTDVVNKKELGILNDKYKIFILKDVINLIKCDNEDFYGLIEQIICSRGEKFIGTKLSTYSNYIYRLRGYMNDIKNKNYYVNTELNTQDNKIEQEWYIEMNCLDQIWSREFKDGFNFTNIFNIQVVYSIGIRCITEMILKQLDLVKFSSIFGSMNIKNYNNIIKCFDTNFDILFDKNNLIYTKDNKQFESCNKEYGIRTLHKIFDDVNDYHSSTIAHHDLSDINTIKHFERGINRLHYIKDNNIPILFVNISYPDIFINNTYSESLINSLKIFGFKNMRIITILCDINAEKTILNYIDDIYIIYTIKSYGYQDINDSIEINKLLLKHFKFNNLISKDFIDDN